MDDTSPAVVLCSLSETLCGGWMSVVVLVAARITIRADGGSLCGWALGSIGVEACSTPLSFGRGVRFT
jgi:hypothetical protein